MVTLGRATSAGASSAEPRFLSSSTDCETFGSTSSASPTRPTLAEQRLDRLDAGAVTGDGDLLSEAVATLGTGPGGSCLSGGAGRGLEQMVFAVRGGGLDAIGRQADDPAACARIFRAGR